MKGGPVNNSQKAATPARLHAQRARPTIGLLINTSIRAVLEPQWSGVADKAQELGVNLICFAGNILRTPLPFAGQANAVYDLASPENVDGLIIWSAGLNWYASPEEMASFCQRYRLLPIVSVEVPFEGIPSVLTDDSQGMRAAITHLVEVHDRRRIAFLRGPEGHPAAQERYRAYVEALAEHGIPLDDGLIVQGDFERSSGAEAMRVLLEERQVEFEALATVNDGMAIGALDALQARGRHTPEDVAIVNFIDSPAASVTTPPLTVVAPPFYTMGQRAVETLVAHMAGQPVPEREYVAPILIVRQSCGCPNPEVVQARVKLVAGSGEASSVSFVTRRSDILSEMASSFVGIAADQVGQLLDAFDAELKGEASGIFVSTLERILHQVAAAGGEVEACQGAVSALRRHVLPYLGDREDRDQAENLWQQARVLIGEAALLTQARRQFQAEQQAELLREIGQSILTTFEMADLMDLLAQQLPRVGISSCYLSLYEGKDMPAQWSRLALAYDERGRTELEAGGRRFPSRQLVPGDWLPHERQCNMVVLPLYYMENQLGFVLFELGLRDGTVSETLRAQLSSSLNVILLWQEREAARMERERLLTDLERRALQLQTAAEVSRAASSILDLDELLSQTVELIRDHFALYYVGLFLMDDAGRYAVLRAGTGEAGRQMLEAGHRLESGGASMIGWCTANAQARIAQHVGEEAARFDNPLLPETRSELALPLISRGQAIGALTIQSGEEAAFSEEDIAVLQTMADQVATAIANARLYKALVQEQYLMKALMDTIPDYIYFKDTQSRFIRTTKAHAKIFGLSDAAEAIGKTDFDFFTEEHARPAYEDEQEIIKTGQPMLGIEERETWPDRPDTWVLTSKLPLHDEEGNIVGTFGISSDITARKRTEKALERRALQLQTAAEVSRAASSILDPDALIQQVVDLVRERFDLYYAGLFLVEDAPGAPDKWAVLRAGTGEAGQRMLEQGHRLKVGGESMIGWCVANAQARIVQHLGEDAVRFANPLLPNTRSEMALPLIARGQVIGAMTIHSEEEEAFSEEDISVLQTMAGQVANAIANARLFEQAQNALQEMEATHRRYLRQAWAEYLETVGVGTYETGRPGTTPLGDTVLPEIQRAVQRHGAAVWTGHVGEEEDASALVAPIALRGEIIGALGIHDEAGTRQWTDEEIALVEAVTERMAITAESLRLLDETQRRAARERLTGEVTARVREALDVDAVLKTAAQEMRQALGLSKLTVRLAGRPSAPGGNVEEAE
jgi:PAS domain S-box-containing protein